MTPADVRPCPADLVEPVLERLGFARAPEPDLPGLDALYGAFCAKVPFDNVRKRAFFASGGAGPLPGSSPEAFFRDWLAGGTGGTCWASAGALAALLSALGFTARRGLATMHPGPQSRGPNHGTVVVELDDEQWLVDPSTVHGLPLPLRGRARGGALGGAEVRPGPEGLPHLFWRPLHNPAGITFRVDEVGASEPTFSELHEASRQFSLFNQGLHARVARGGGLVGVAMGLRVELRADGSVSARRLDEASRVRVLVEDLAIAEELAVALPPDEPVAPPPGMPPERWAQVVEGFMAALPTPEA